MSPRWIRRPFARSLARLELRLAGPDGRFTAMDYVFCEPLGLILTTTRDLVTTADVRNFHRKLMIDPAVPSGTRELVDLRKLVRVEVDVQAIQAIASVEAAQSRRIGEARIAVVALLPVAFGMGRMYQMLSAGSPAKVSVYPALAPALEWLGITVDEIRRHVPGFEP